MFKFKNPYNSFNLQFFKVHFHVIIEKKQHKKKLTTTHKKTQYSLTKQ